MATKRYHFKIENAAGERVAYAEVDSFSTLLEVLEHEADRLSVDRSDLRVRIIQTPDDFDAEVCEVGRGEYCKNS